MALVTLDASFDASVGGGKNTANSGNSGGSSSSLGETDRLQRVSLLQRAQTARLVQAWVSLRLNLMSAASAQRMVLNVLWQLSLQEGAPSPDMLLPRRVLSEVMSKSGGNPAFVKV